MISLFFSLFVYDAEYQAFVCKSLYSSDLDFLVGSRGKWLFSEIQGGIGLDGTSAGCDFGFSDLYLRAGVNRYVRMFDVGLFPVLHRPGRCKEGTIRNFSIKQPGLGFGMRLGTEILWFLVAADVEYLEHFSDPITEHFLFDAKVGFNPDTLTFGFDFSLERFTMVGQTPVVSIYVKPKVILSRWDNFALNFGFAFRVSGKPTSTSENAKLTELGINTGDYGFPSWKLCFGVSSPDLHRKSHDLLSLRIILVNEEGDPASGLLSLADSGSFQVHDGEIEFDLPEGIYPLSVYSGNRLPADTVIVLKSKTEVLIRLQKKPELYFVEGKIVDVETGGPLYAEISIDNSDASKVYSNSENGFYKLYLTPGDYVIKVASKGYYTSTSLVEIKAGRFKKLNFELLPVKKEKK